MLSSEYIVNFLEKNVQLFSGFKIGTVLILLILINFKFTNEKKMFMNPKLTTKKYNKMPKFEMNGHQKIKNY